MAARVQIPLIITSVDDTTNDLAPVSGATVSVANRISAVTQPVYANESTGTPSTQPLTTNGQGLVAGYIERAPVRFTITIPGHSPYTVDWDAAPAKDGSIDTLWLADGVITAVKIADGTITNAKLAGNIALSKLATDPLARANHTGTQLAATISDFNAAADARASSIFTSGYAGQGSVSGDGLPSEDGAAAIGVSNHWARADHIHADHALGSVFQPTGPYTQTSSTSAAAGTQYSIQVRVPTRATVTGVRYRIGSTAAGATSSGLFDSTGAYIVSSAPISQSSSGSGNCQNLPFNSGPVPIVAGIYYLALLNFSGGTWHAGRCLAPANVTLINGGAASLASTAFVSVAPQNIDLPVACFY